ncbi:CG42303, partial [Drosophila busckii]
SGSNYKELYKLSVDLGEHQKQRQLQLLNEQKQRRQLQQDEFRDVTGEEEEKEKLPPKQQQSKQPKPKSDKNNTNRGHQHKLQLSEWLRQRPENLCDWFLLPCPVGKRCLVVATYGKTRVYNKAGRTIMRLRTQLPGDWSAQRSRTVLDCVYVQELDTFYVLDALAFGQQRLQECEASFRFYWLQSRFAESVYLNEVSEHNDKAFKLLPYYDFEDAVAIDQALQRYPLWDNNQPRLDGMLFYHKEASYVYGNTPLVCWLFAFMLPDVLGLPVSSEYKRPEEYNGQAVLKYMNEFDKKLQTQRMAYRKQSWRRTEQTAQSKSDATVDAAVEHMDEAVEHMDAAEEEEEEDEFLELRDLIDRERRLELGELDMDCSPDIKTATT